MKLFPIKGGGEKVLWEAVNALYHERLKYQVYVYTRDDAAESDILSRAESRFRKVFISDKSTKSELA